MRLGLVWVALGCWASTASAQVSLVRHADADDEVATALEQLIGEDVVVVEPAAAAKGWDASVSIDRERAVLSVVSPSNPTGLTRTLDEDLIADSPYAVALAAAELLDWLPRASDPVSAATSPAGRSGGLLSYAFGLDVEVQSQLTNELTFVRPAFAGELAWGRGRPGLFWTLGGRVSAPLARELPLAAAQASLQARAFDAAAQVVGGYGFGALALTAHAAAGASYLRVEARDALGELGHDTFVSPLLAAGLGVRWSVALGFALAARGEAQWAGPASLYNIHDGRVLETHPWRFGAFVGVLWESALGLGRHEP
jgi:hypothetical protein